MILNPAGEPVVPKTSALKPCPFCGGTNMNPESINGFSSGAARWLRCQACSCTGGYGFGDDAKPELARQRWNTRSLETEIRKKTLEEMLQFLDMHTPGEGTVTNPIRLSFKVLRTELVKLTACKDLDEYLSHE